MLEQKVINKVYPFNKVWNNGKPSDIKNFTYHRLGSFVDRLYKARQMEEMWFEKAKEDGDWYLQKLCENNVKTLDTRIAFEENAVKENKQTNKKYNK